MSYWYYFLPAGAAWFIALWAFSQDDTAAKTSPLNWIFVLAVGLLWPVTLPAIIWKQLKGLSSRTLTSAGSPLRVTKRAIERSQTSL